MIGPERNLAQDARGQSWLPEPSLSPLGPARLWEVAGRRDALLGVRRAVLVVCLFFFFLN